MKKLLAILWKLVADWLDERALARAKARRRMKLESDIADLQEEQDELLAEHNQMARDRNLTGANALHPRLREVSRRLGEARVRLDSGNY